MKIALDLYGAPIYVRKEIVHLTATLWKNLRQAREPFSLKNWPKCRKGRASFSAPMGFRPQCVREAIERKLLVIRLTLHARS